MNIQSTPELCVSNPVRRGVGASSKKNLRMLAVATLLPVLTTDLSAAQMLNMNPGWPGTTLSGVQCYGDATDSRFDYITERNRIGIVEKFHFYRDIEQLKMHDSKLDNDLDYTLRWIPNHHRALWARARFYLRSLKSEAKREQLQRKERSRQGNPPPECYFNRAKAFNPRDGMVPAIFGIYLHKRDMHEAALTQYKLAEEMLPKHAELIYNIGLLYFDMGNLDRAREYADKASALGFPLKGLRRKLGSTNPEADEAASADN